MQVLMFGWEFPPHISGGLGTACYGLTKAMLRAEMDLLFVVPKLHGDEPGEGMELINASGVEMHPDDEVFQSADGKISLFEIDSTLLPYATEEEYLKLADELAKVQQVKKLQWDAKTYSFSGGYGKSLMEEVKRYAIVASNIAKTYDFDIIHAHDWLTYLAGIEARKISGKPLVVHMHATEFDRSGQHVNPAVFEIEQTGMQAADKVVAVSHLTRDTVIQKYGIDPDKVITVHNGVDPPAEKSPIDTTKHFPERIVTFLGRVTYQKGPEYFIEAAHKVLQRDDNVRFVMAGSGDMLPRMIRRVAELGMGTRFHFTGFLRGADVDRMYGMSDAYVMPSVSEPFGISPLEAMRSNVPVIISKQSGVAEVLKHALKVDYWDVDGMADAIYGTLNYPGLRSMFKKHGKNEVEGIKWDQAAHKLKKIYHHMLHE